MCCVKCKKSALFSKPALITIGLVFLLLLSISAFIGEGNFQVFLRSANLILATFLLFTLTKKLGYFLVFPVITVLSLEITYRVNFKERVSLSVLKSIADTNYDEISGLLGDLLISSIPITLIFIFLLYICYYYLSVKVDSVLLKLIVIIIPLISTGLTLTGKFKNPRFISDVNIYPARLGDYLYSKNNLLYGDVPVIYTTYLTNKKYTKNDNKITHQSILNKIDSDHHLIVFVIGESSVSSRYSAYGYKINTTPHIEHLFNKDDACIISHVHSSAPITRDSIAMTLSFHTPENIASLFNEKSVIDLAKENGYKTYWITSQVLEGLHDTKYGFLAKDSDHADFTNREDNLLPVKLKEVLTDEEYKRFIVLHMAGSHAPYKDKYDPEDAIALPDSHDYDKSIHKTDRIIHNIIKILTTNKEPYIFFFVSDHGEIIDKGHGIMYGGKEQYKIPMLIKGSDKLCQFTESLRHHNGYINALNNKIILLKILGYEVDSQYLKKEIQTDRVLHSDGRVYSWENIPTQHYVPDV